MNKDFNTRKLSLVVSILNIVFIAIYSVSFGFYLITPDYLTYILEVVISLPLAFFFGIIFHEFGHYLFGIMSGYHLVSFQVLWFKFHYINDKLKISFVKAFVLGQCLMSYKPNSEYDNAKYRLYLYGGSLMNVFISLLTLTAFFLSLFLNGNFKFDFLSFGIVNLSLFLSNGLPLNINGVFNDALNIKLMNKYDSIKHAVLNQLKLQKLSETGYLIEEIDEDIISNDYLELPNGCTNKYPFILYGTMNLFQKEDEDPFKLVKEIHPYMNIYPEVYRELNISMMFLYYLINKTDCRWIVASKEYKNYFNLKKNKDDLLVKLDMTIYDYRYNNLALSECINKLNEFIPKIDKLDLLDIEKEFINNLYKYSIKKLVEEEVIVNG